MRVYEHLFGVLVVLVVLPIMLLAVLLTLTCLSVRCCYAAWWRKGTHQEALTQSL